MPTAADYSGPSQYQLLVQQRGTPTYEDFYGPRIAPQFYGQPAPTLAPPAPMDPSMQRSIGNGIAKGMYSPGTPVGQQPHPAPPLHPHQGGPTPSVGPALAPRSMAPRPLGVFASVWRASVGHLVGAAAVETGLGFRPVTSTAVSSRIS